MEQYLNVDACPCGRRHHAPIDAVIVGSGVLEKLPQIIEKYGAKKPFLVADVNTYQAAGERVAQLLTESGIDHSRYVFPNKALKPDEHAVGSLVMHFDHSCDMVIGVGSGVINDICKILCALTGKTFIIIGTAPSMDGYASSSSSMERDGLKQTLYNRCADVIIGDTDILKNAPMEMLKAGIGDMLAKYVSIAEWRISHLINGEYYCEEVAGLVRKALKKCVENAAGLMERDETAVADVFEGLVISGIAMTYAGVSRPASGVEHYFSHVQDMRGLEFGTPTQLHGIQCARGTAVTVRLYEKLAQMKPDRDKALQYVENFDYEAWCRELRAFIGKGADTMIAQEEREGKYSVQKHRERLPVILENWENILRILKEELPTGAQLAQIMDTVGIPCSLDVDKETAVKMFRTTKDIRDKYVLSHLAWDLGLMDNLCEEV